MATKSAAEWTTVTNSSGLPVYDSFTQPIAKSLLDNREYRYIRLPNHLEALIVSDSETDKAAAALDVGVGHLTDPDDMPGCAHFCEHLLFMGTEEFPSENEYSQYISSHGGSTNAFTSAYNTNYYFSVSHTSLSGALDRFSAFFKNPLFSPSCTARELKAVDSEHKKNLQNDTWRMFQLSKLLSRSDHQWRKFGSGNKESLLSVGKAKLREAALEKAQEQAILAAGKSKANGILMDVDSRGYLTPPIPGSAAISRSASPSLEEEDGGVAGRETRRRLVEWWEKQYCASRMKLVILGKESLEELTEMAVRYFSAVPNRSLGPAPRFEESPFGPDDKGIVAYSKTIMDFKALEVVWCVPWQPPLYKVKPVSFISHFLGHEGPGSLHSYLKNKGWVTYLSAGPSSGAPGFDFFKVTIVLTKEGFENHVEVLKSVYSYLSLLRATSSEELKATQEEIIKLSNIFFRYREKSSSPSSYVSRFAERISHPYPKEKVLSASSVTEECNEGLIREYLEKYITPRQGRVMMMAREGWSDVKVVGEDQPSERTWSKEPWYGTEYFVRRIPEQMLQEAEGPNSIPELTIPKRNMFVPDNLDVEKKEVAEPLKRPLKIRETAKSTLWYKKDDRFWVPKANVDLLIVSPLVTMTPKHNVASRLYVDLVRDSLTEFAYDADLAGLAYDVNIHAEGISVVVSGYNEKLVVLLKVVLDKVKDLEVQEDRFNVLKEQLRQEYENMAMDQPYHTSDYYARYLLSPKAWTPAEKLAELNALRSEDVRLHIREFLSRTYIQALVHGNLMKDSSDFERIDFRPVTSPALVYALRASYPLLAVVNPISASTASNYVLQLDVPNKNDVNSALTYYLEIGDIADPRIRSILGLFAHIANEPAFNQLRTVEQLGYIVSSSSWGSTGSIGWRVVVQSEKDPIYLEHRVNRFFTDTLGPLLENMSEDEFEQKRRSLIQKKLEKFKNLGDETNSFWTHITSGYHDFMRRAVDAEILSKVTKKDVIDLFTRAIHPSSSTRAKISIQLKSQIAPATRFSKEASRRLVEALRQKGVPVDDSALEGDEPLLSDVRQFWTEQFKSIPDFEEATAQELLQTIDTLAKQHPSADSTLESLGSDVIPVQNMAMFKAGLAVSKAATPVEIYSDLDAKL
ncbi:Insulinase (Peptidase M16) [Tulasnella sp. 408]|nr:Insulinase (Peptidase M16) [Tulasnella sp. 408]